MSLPPTQLRLSVDWELWVVEQLLFTAKLEDVVELLAAQGVDAKQARVCVMEVLRSPNFESLLERVGEARMAARLLRLQDALERGDRVPTRIPVAKDIDRQTLFEQHWVASRPLLLTEAARNIPAVRHWSLSHLAERFPELKVQVNTDRLQARVHRDTETRARFISLPAL
ncbi:MAG: hypothetical protein KUG77_03090, partial [Nannocystaceae bacterium]|nr:hypothetical protein [Nannocystaceae bacterium]